MMARGPRAAALLVAALVLGLVGSAQAQEVPGSVLLHDGTLLSVDRLRFTGGGCAENIRDGVAGAYVRLGNAKRITLKFKSADVRLPSSRPILTVRLYPGCDPASLTISRSCNATPICSIPVNGERFAEITFAHIFQQTTSYGVRFTYELTT